LNIVADENLHRGIADRLATDGHDVVHVGDLSPAITDIEVLRLTVEREALMITNDLDFGELVFRGAASHAGVLLVRLADMAFEDQAELVSTTVADHGEALEGAFSVLTARKLRIRGGSAES